MSMDLINTIIQEGQVIRQTVDWDQIRQNIQQWPILSRENKIVTLRSIGYQIIDNRVISYKAIDKNGFDMGHTYQYIVIGDIIVDKYSVEAEFLDPDPHTPGGIWSDTIYNKASVYQCNRNNLLNHYVKIDSDLDDVRLCYDGAIKNRKIRLLEIQGTHLHP